MATCGMYDYAGSWLYEVGMPAKSGVGGGIIAVLPGRFGIGIFSPPLDAKGNSVRSIEVCKQLSKGLGLNVFSYPGRPQMALSRVYTGADAPSKRQFTGDARERVDARASRIKYLSLHGCLAVDGIEYIIRKMDELATDADSFILDFNQATGITDPAALLLERARAGFAERGLAVVYSRLHARQDLISSLSRAATTSGGHGFLAFEDNDLAVEWCENRLLGETAAQPGLNGSIASSPLFEGVDASLVALVEAVTQRQTFAGGEPILQRGQENDRRIFFIETGHVSVLVPLKAGGHQRIVSMGPGTNFGEMILLGGKTRSASVYADTEVVCRVLDANDIDRLSRDHPALRIALLENLARDLAGKLRRSTQWIAALA
jgi:glutaminase